MTRHKLRAIWLIGLLALATLATSTGGVAASATAANTATEISSCTTIDSSGAYVLTEDLNATSPSSCLSIQASNVTLDGNGHVIQGYENNTFDNRGDPVAFNGSTAVHVVGTSGTPLENVRPSAVMTAGR